MPIANCVPALRRHRSSRPAAANAMAVVAGAAANGVWRARTGWESAPRMADRPYRNASQTQSSPVTTGAHRADQSDVTEPKEFVAPTKVVTIVEQIHAASSSRIIQL